ncbi:hypothetical protein BGZ94_006302, partial [Podila epigama]
MESPKAQKSKKRKGGDLNDGNFKKALVSASEPSSLLSTTESNSKASVIASTSETASSDAETAPDVKGGAHLFGSALDELNMGGAAEESVDELSSDDESARAPATKPAATMADLLASAGENLSQHLSSVNVDVLRMQQQLHEQIGTPDTDMTREQIMESMTGFPAAQVITAVNNANQVAAANNASGVDHSEILLNMSNDPSILATIKPVPTSDGADLAAEAAAGASSAKQSKKKAKAKSKATGPSAAGSSVPKTRLSTVPSLTLEQQLDADMG